LGCIEASEGRKCIDLVGQEVNVGFLAELKQGVKYLGWADVSIWVVRIAK
jgi:hypothetical protein